MAGAALLGLEGDIHHAGAEARIERGLHLLVLVTQDRDHAGGTRGARRRHDPVEQGTTRNSM